jgi:hypothetical protein
MKKITFFAIVVLLFYMVSCKEDNNEEQISTDSIKVNFVGNSDTDVEPANIEEKVVRDTQVLFFLPSPRERVQMVKFYGTYDQYDFQAVFNNFLNLSQVVKSALKPRGIPVEVTYAKRFVFPMTDDTLIYDLEEENQIMGYILADGESMPLIKNGVQKRRQVSNDLRNYFNLKNFKIAQ